VSAAISGGSGVLELRASDKTRAPAADGGELGSGETLAADGGKLAWRARGRLASGSSW
jgi:hypothetical protein